MEKKKYEAAPKEKEKLKKAEKCQEETQEVPYLEETKSPGTDEDVKNPPKSC